MNISIVSPVYNAEDLVPELVRRITAEVSKITGDFEIILVEDGSQDASWLKIQAEGAKNKKVKGLKLSRNFGQHYAITAGLDQAKGDWVVVLDCDLQDRPEEIGNLYKKALEGFDVVLAKRVDRQDSFMKRTGSKMFYRVLGYLTGSRQDESVANFGIYSKSVVSTVCGMRESIRYFPTMIKWVGFSQTSIDVIHAERSSGETGYNFRRLMGLAMDIILAYSDKPLRMAVEFGLWVSGGSCLVGVFYIFKWLSGDILVLGYTSLILSIWFLSGCIIAVLGVVGLYVGKTFEGVKGRPIYIVARKLNYD